MPPEFIMWQRQNLESPLSKLSLYWRFHAFGKCGLKATSIVLDGTDRKHPISIFAAPIGVPFKQDKVHRDLIAKQ